MNRSDHDGNAQVLQPNDADTERNTELKPEISQCINSASKVKPEMTATNAEMATATPCSKRCENENEAGNDGKG